MGRFIGKLQLSFLAIFLLTLNATAGGSIAGKVTILKGQVFIQRGSQKIQVKKGDTVLESDTIESEAGTARITMIDSNLVDVYPRSKVEIAKYIYKPNKDQKEVELKVDFGKIKSTVNQKYDGAKNKFQVKTPSAVAGVRGTVFTAEYDRIKKVSRVVTIEGLVAVSKMIDRERQAPPVFVRPNQVVKVDIEQSKAEQPRDLKPEERDVRQKEDKDLGYQYDPKKEPREEVPSAAKEPPKNIDQANRPAPEPKDIPVKEIREPVKQIKESVTSAINNSNARQQQEQQAQERRQKELEEEQARKQKQLEEEQAKKQKQSEEELARKQKHNDEEQAQKRIQEEAQKKAELARRLAEIAKRAGSTLISRPPSGTDTPTTTTPPKN